MGFAYLLMMSVLTTWGLFVLTFRFCSRYKIVLSEWNPSEWNVNAFIMRVCLLLRSTCDILLQCIVFYCHCLSTFTQHFLMRKKFKNNMKQPDSLCVNGGGGHVSKYSFCMKNSCVYDRIIYLNLTIRHRKYVSEQ